MASGRLQPGLDHFGAGHRTKEDFTGQLAAFFNHQFAVADGAGDFAGGINHQLLAHRQVAIEFATDFGYINFGQMAGSGSGGDVMYVGYPGQGVKGFEFDHNYVYCSGSSANFFREKEPKSLKDGR